MPKPSLKKDSSATFYQTVKTNSIPSKINQFGLKEKKKKAFYF